MVYLSMNWMVLEVPRVVVEAEDHAALGEEAVVAKSHVLVEMVQDHGEEVEGSDDQRFLETHQIDCGHSSHHRNYPVKTIYPNSNI